MIFVLLAALLAIQGLHAPAIINGATAAPTEPVVFGDFLPDDITAIRLRSLQGGTFFVLARDANGNWSAPDSTGTLNTTEAENIARTMVLMPYSHTVSIQPGEDKTTYGFTSSTVLDIEIILKNGRTHAVVIGYRTPTGDGYYAIIDNRSELYVVERAPVDYIISRLKSPPVS
jgi:hypothetical protein